MLQIKSIGSIGVATFHFVTIRKWRLKYVLKKSENSIVTNQIINKINPEAIIFKNEEIISGKVFL